MSYTQLIDRLLAVQSIVATSCNHIEAQCAYEELDYTIPLVESALKELEILKKEKKQW